MWFKTKTKDKLYTITSNIMEKYSKPCDVIHLIHPSSEFEKFVKPCCRDYDAFFELNPENRRGRFYGRAFMYVLGGNTSFTKHNRGKEFETLYEAYYYARHQAYLIDVGTFNTPDENYPIEWDIKMIINL